MRIHDLDSGEAEAEMIPRRAKSKVTKYLSYNGNVRTYVSTPYYPHNSIFCIGPKDTILEQLKTKLLEVYPDQIEKVITHYHKGASDASQK